MSTAEKNNQLMSLSKCLYQIKHKINRKLCIHHNQINENNNINIIYIKE